MNVFPLFATQPVSLVYGERAASLGDLFRDPVFLCIFAAFAITVINVVIGVCILPRDRRKKGYLLHRYVYYLSLAAVFLYLAANHALDTNRWYDYGLLAYFATVMPWSRKINITLHAVLTSIGLVLLMTVAMLRIG